ncbi:hypothetical protein ACM614_16710 [Streptomyces sp. 12297]
MQQPGKPGEITLYSGADYHGASCAVPANSATYSLEATGLDQIKSIRITQPTWTEADPAADRYTLDVTLYLKHPGSPYDTDIPDVPLRVFAESTPDTGDWAAARYLRAMRNRGGGASGQTQTYGLDETVREIHDTLPPLS